MPGSQQNNIELRDGRILTFDDYGDEHGYPVIFTHGFGESASFRHWNDAVAAEYGLRIITPNLPGVAGSTRHKGRNLRDWAADTLELANALNIGRFIVAGHSAGGAHALASAAVLGDRVTSAVLITPAGEVRSHEDIKHYASRELRGAIRLFRAGFGPAVQMLLNAGGWLTRKSVSRIVELEAKLAPADREALLSPPEQRRVNEFSLHEGMGLSPKGTFDTLATILQPWGFDPATVQQPVHIFVAEADDIIRPPLIDRLAKQLPNSSVTRWKELGHFGLLLEGPWREVLGVISQRAEHDPRLQPAS